MAKVWGYLTVLGAALIHLSFGYNYTVGNMNAYLIPFMGITPGQTVWFHAVVISGQAIGMPIGGWLYSRIGFYPVVAIGSLLSSGGVALSSLTVSKGLGPFIFTYAVMFGLGMGLPYSVLFTLAAEWFPKHRAVVIGLILGGLGMGALVFTPTQTALINPDNKPTNDTTVKEKIPTAFLILAAMMFGLQVIGFLLLRKCKRDESVMNDEIQETFEESEVDTSTNSGEIGANNETDDLETTSQVDVKHDALLNIYDYTVTEALKSIDFYLIAIIIFLDTVPITLQASAYKVFGAENNLDDRFLSIIATCTSIFNCTGRVIWGLLCDHFSFKLPLGWFLLQWTLLFVTFPLLVHSGALQVLYPIWVFLLFFTMAGHFVLMPAACNRIFGSKNSATTYGLLYFTTCPSALILAAIVSNHDIKQNFPLTFYCCGILCFVSFLLSLFLKDKFGVLSHVTRLCVHLTDFMRYVPPAARGDVEEDLFEFEDDASVTVDKK